MARTKKIWVGLHLRIRDFSLASLDVSGVAAGEWVGFWNISYDSSYHVLCLPASFSRNHPEKLVIFFFLLVPFFFRGVWFGSRKLSPWAEGGVRVCASTLFEYLPIIPIMKERGTLTPSFFSSAAEDPFFSTVFFLCGLKFLLLSRKEIFPSSS